MLTSPKLIDPLHIARACGQVCPVLDSLNSGTTSNSPPTGECWVDTGAMAPDLPGVRWVLRSRSSTSSPSLRQMVAADVLAGEPGRRSPDAAAGAAVADVVMDGVRDVGDRGRWSQRDRIGR